MPCRTTSNVIAIRNTLAWWPDSIIISEDEGAIKNIL